MPQICGYRARSGMSSSCQRRRVAETRRTLWGCSRSRPVGSRSGFDDADDDLAADPARDRFDGRGRHEPGTASPAVPRDSGSVLRAGRQFVIRPLGFVLVDQRSPSVLQGVTTVAARSHGRRGRALMIRRPWVRSHPPHKIVRSSCLLRPIRAVESAIMARLCGILASIQSVGQC
jgi:hypothetical protein